jgi:hypothetical protein
MLCESGICEPTFDAFGSMSGGKCVEATVTPDYPRTCEEDVDCGAGVFAEGICTCGRNPDGKAFCEPYFGDQPKQDYLNLLKKHLKSPNIHFCQTTERFSEDCFKITGVVPHAIYKQITLISENPVAFLENDECTKAILHGDVFDAMTHAAQANFIAARLALV